MPDSPISVTIALDSHDEEIAVLGSRDQFLRQIRDSLGIKILARHGELRIDGDADRVDRAQKVFSELRQLYATKVTISSTEVNRILDETNPSASKLAELSPAPTPLEIREGSKVVRARTEGQAAYLKALKDNELVFAQPVPAKHFWLWPWLWALCDLAASRKSFWSGPPLKLESTWGSSQAISKPKSIRISGLCWTPSMI